MPKHNPSELARRLEAQTGVDLTNWPVPLSPSWDQEQHLREIWDRHCEELKNGRYEPLLKTAHRLENKCRSIEERIHNWAKVAADYRQKISEVKAIVEEEGENCEVCYTSNEMTVKGPPQSVLNRLERLLTNIERHIDDLSDEWQPAKFELEMLLKALALYDVGVREFPSWKDLNETQLTGKPREHAQNS